VKFRVLTPSQREHVIAASHSPDPEVQFEALISLMEDAAERGEFAHGLQLASAAVAVGRAHGNPEWTKRGMFFSAGLAWGGGRRELAKEAYAELIDYCTEAGFGRDVVQAMTWLAEMHGDEGERELTLRWLSAAEARCADPDELEWVAWQVNKLGQRLLWMGTGDFALEILEIAARISLEANDVLGTSIASFHVSRARRDCGVLEPAIVVTGSEFRSLSVLAPTLRLACLGIRLGHLLVAADRNDEALQIHGLLAVRLSDLSSEHLESALDGVRRAALGYPEAISDR